MNVSLTDELDDFVQKKIASGMFPSEEAVLQEAVRRLRQHEQTASLGGEAAAAEDLIDFEAIAYCAREVEGERVPSIEDVHQVLSKISGSMAQAIIDAREDRF